MNVFHRRYQNGLLAAVYPKCSMRTALAGAHPAELNA